MSTKSQCLLEFTRAKDALDKYTEETVNPMKIAWKTRDQNNCKQITKLKTEINNHFRNLRLAHITALDNWVKS